MTPARRGPVTRAPRVAPQAAPQEPEAPIPAPGPADPAIAPEAPPVDATVPGAALMDAMDRDPITGASFAQMAAALPADEPARAVVGTCSCGAEQVIVLAPEYAAQEGACHLPLDWQPRTVHPLEAAGVHFDLTFRAAGVAGPARKACPHNAPDGECDACAAAAPDDGGFEIPLDEGEEIVAQATRLEPVVGTDEMVPITYLVTSAGRKVGIDPDGWVAVVMGPDLDVIQPPAPKPPRASWKEPRD